MIDGFQTHPSADLVKSLADGVGEWPLLEDPETEVLYHRAVYRLGRELERVKEPEAALRVYAYSDQFPATERNVRLLVQTGCEPTPRKPWRG